MITVVGLGTEKGDITLNGVNAVKSADKVFIRTALTRTHCTLDELGIKYRTFDDIYELATDFADLNARIAKTLEDEHGNVCYCVDGSGTDDGSVIALHDKTVVPGVSHGDRALTDCISTSRVVFSAYDFVEKPLINRNVTTVIKDIDNNYLASEIKLILCDLVGDECQIVFYRGTHGEKIKVYELDRREFSFDTGVVIEACKLTEKTRFGFCDLMEILAVLRGENGCPWDKAQTHESIRKNLIEEAYELCEAIDKGDPDMMQEETGDVMLQASFHAIMGEEYGEFTVADVLSTLCTKLITRHTHIFGDVKASTPEEALQAWENAKKLEKHTTSAKDAVDKIAKTLPSLMRASKVIKIAQKADVAEASWDGDAVKAKIDGGDYSSALFGTCCIMRKNGLDAEEELGKKLTELEDAINEKS